MAGTGDVVMTDVRKISASLIFGADYDGRFYVLDASGQLVAEMEKPEGRTIELGPEPGDSTDSLRGVVVGGRYYPGLRGSIRPYLAASLGAFDSSADSGASFGTVAGVGADFYLGRRPTFSLQGTFSRVSGQTLHVETRVGLGWTWGGRRPASDPPLEATAH